MKRRCLCWADAAPAKMTRKSLRLALLACCCAAHAAGARALPLYRDPNATVDERVADLLARMTLEEKVAQLLHPWPSKLNASAAIQLYGATGLGALYGWGVELPGLNTTASINVLQETFFNTSRLGIPVTLVAETLHSSVTGGTAFPNPTLLASSWNTSLVAAVGAVIAAEARASGVQRGFAPVLQVTTDPRFGRFEEAFGEDPLLVSAMGVAMVLGQQGAPVGPSAYADDPTAKLSCEAKHAVAYGYSGRDWYRADGGCGAWCWRRARSPRGAGGMCTWGPPQWRPLYTRAVLY